LPMKIGDLVRWKGQTPEGRPPDSDFGCIGVVVDSDEAGYRLVIIWIDGTVGIFNYETDDLEIINVE